MGNTLGVPPVLSSVTVDAAPRVWEDIVFACDRLLTMQPDTSPEFATAVEAAVSGMAKSVSADKVEYFVRFAEGLFRRVREVWKSGDLPPHLVKSVATMFGETTHFRKLDRCGFGTVFWMLIDNVLEKFVAGPEISVTALQTCVDVFRDVINSLFLNDKEDQAAHAPFVPDMLQWVFELPKHRLGDLHWHSLLSTTVRVFRRFQTNTDVAVFLIDFYGELVCQNALEDDRHFEELKPVVVRALQITPRLKADVDLQLIIVTRLCGRFLEVFSDDPVFHDDVFSALFDWTCCWYSRERLHVVMKMMAALDGAGSAPFTIKCAKVLASALNTIKRIETEERQRVGILVVEDVAKYLLARIQTIERFDRETLSSTVPILGEVFQYGELAYSKTTKALLKALFRKYVEAVDTDDARRHLFTILTRLGVNASPPTTLFTQIKDVVIKGTVDVASVLTLSDDASEWYAAPTPCPYYHDILQVLEETLPLFK